MYCKGCKWKYWQLYTKLPHPYKTKSLLLQPLKGIQKHNQMNRDLPNTPRPLSAVFSFQGLYLRAPTRSPWAYLGAALVTIYFLLLYRSITCCTTFIIKFERNAIEDSYFIVLPFNSKVYLIPLAFWNWRKSKENLLTFVTALKIV